MTENNHAMETLIQTINDTLSEMEKNIAQNQANETVQSLKIQNLKLTKIITETIDSLDNYMASINEILNNNDIENTAPPIKPNGKNQPKNYRSN